MASSSAGYSPPLERAGSSSSSRSPPKPATVDEDSDNDDPVAASFSRDQDLLTDDPLEADGEDIVSFKRKQKQTPGSRFLSAISGNGSNSRQATPPPIRGGTPTLITGRSLGLNTIGASRDTGSNSKDGGSLDWYVEGPGRRVGYQDLTAIDWIFEYTKERQRLRMLYSSASGFLGYAVQFWDASQVWILLILTGLAAGVFAASIDVASDWLGDVKTGYCSAGEGSAGEGGGHFYLNKYFCCYGYDELAQCGDWVPWSLALHITSAGGKWFIEYFFFIIFSVCTAFAFPAISNGKTSDCICYICKCFGEGVRIICKTQRDTRNQDGPRWLCDSAFYGCLDISDKVTGIGKSTCGNSFCYDSDSRSALQLHRGCGWAKKDHLYMLHVVVPTSS
jgi:chloride channel 3/4/5